MALVPMIEHDDGIWYAGYRDTITGAIIWNDWYDNAAEAWEASTRACMRDEEPIVLEPDDVIPLTQVVTRGRPIEGYPGDAITARQFQCPHCGERMTYWPMRDRDGTYWAAAICERCSVGVLW